MEFNGSAFTTAAVVSGLAYGLYAFTTRGNQNQNRIRIKEVVTVILVNQ